MSLFGKKLGILLTCLLLAQISFGADATASQTPLKETSLSKGFPSGSQQVSGKLQRSDVKGGMTLSKSPLQLQMLTSETANGVGFISIELSRKPDWKETPQLEMHGSFLQLQLPETLIPEPGKFYESKVNGISKMAVFQANANDGAIRFFTNMSADAVKQAAKVEILDRIMMISIDGTAFSTPNGGEAKAELTGGHTGLSSTNSPTESSAENVSGGIMSKDKETAASLSPVRIPGMSTTFNGYMVKVTSVVGFLIMFLVVVSILKPKLRRKFSQTSSNQIQLKQLSSLSLAPKQKLSLIQVGNERLLLSIAPEGVRLLKTLDGQASFSEQLSRGLLLDRTSTSTGALTQPSSTLVLRNQGAKTGFESSSSTQRMSREYSDDAMTSTRTREQVSKNSSEIGDERDLKGRSRINVAIDDDGIHDHSRKSKTNSDRLSNGTISDVTRLIREKLKNVPPG